MVSHSGLITVMTRAVRKAAPRLRRVAELDGDLVFELIN